MRQEFDFDFEYDGRQSIGDALNVTGFSISFFWASILMRDFRIFSMGILVVHMLD